MNSTAFSRIEMRNAKCLQGWKGPLAKCLSRFHNMMREQDSAHYLWDRHFFGLIKGLNDSIHYLYDGPKASYIQFLVAARKAETEANDMKVEMAKAGALGGTHSSQIEALTKQNSN